MRIWHQLATLFRPVAINSTNINPETTREEGGIEMDDLSQTSSEGSESSDLIVRTQASHRQSLPDGRVSPRYLTHKPRSSAETS